jgi:hypothetical protein
MMPGNAPTKLLERVPFGRAPSVPPSPWERLESWRRRYNALPIEQQIGYDPGKAVVRVVSK